MSHVKDEIIPDTEEFSYLLKGLSLTPDAYQNPDSIVGAEGLRSNMMSGDYPETLLYAPKLAMASLPWLVSATEKYLEQAGHLAASKVTPILISLFVFHQDRMKDPVSAFRKFITNLADWDVNHYLMLPNRAPENLAATTIGPFRLGSLDVEKVQYQCKKAGSDFFERYKKNLLLTFSISRKPKKVKILPVNNVKELKEIGIEGSLGYSLVDRYFLTVGQATLNGMLTEFRDVQTYAVVSGLPYLDIRPLWRIPGCQSLSIFISPKGGGWVAPYGAGMIFEMGGLSLIHEKLVELESAGLGDQVNSNEFGRIVRAFGQMLIRAKEHETDDRADEEFMTYMIGLESVFGTQDAPTRAVSERIAMLLGINWGASPLERMRLVRNLYDMRSRYVHEGTSCAKESIELIRKVAHEIGQRLIQMAVIDSQLRPESVDKWLLGLDAAWKCYEAGITLSAKDQKALGIQP